MTKDELDGGPEIRETEDGQVLIEGEQPEPTPTEAEPSKTDDGTDEPAVSPYEEKFKELGLDKQFPGGIEEMIERIPNTNKYVTDLERERNFYREIAQKTQDVKKSDQQSEGPSEQDFYDNPKVAIEQLVNQRYKQLESDFDKYKAESFIESKPDFREYMNEMQEVTQSLPGIVQNLPASEAVKVLYELAKAKRLPQIVSKAKEIQSPPDKTRAESNTASKVGKKVAGTKTAEDYLKMSDAEIEKEFGVVG